MDRLPLPSFLSIVALAVYDYSEDIVPTKRKFPLTSLQPLALVCKTWHLLVREVAARCQRSTLTLKFSSGTCSEYLNQRRHVTERGAKVVDLNIQLDMAPPREGKSHKPRLGNLSILGNKAFQIDWDVIFSRLPALKRLDLSGVQLFSGQVELILQCAAKYCKHVESVVLATVDEMLQCRVDFDAVLGALCNALKTWYLEGTRRGLRQLTVPGLDERNRQQLFDNVVKFCPELEYLDGYKKTLCEVDKLTCCDVWLITVDQWKDFNTKCTQLREFHWIVAPFADQFFRVFGEHVKPRMKKLTFAVNMMWEWEEYFDLLEMSAETSPSFAWLASSQRPGYGVKATDASSALKGCPALEDLSIELYHPADEGVMGYNDPFGNDDLAEILDHEVVNIDIYGDNFCETLAKHCPWLTKFCIWEVAENHNSYFTPIRTFTDKGLVALAKLKYLSSLELRTINCTGNGIFEFLNSFSDEFLGQRTFQICVGGHPSEYRLAFYNAVIELLMQLEAKSPAELGWGRRKFVLRLMNSNFDSVESEWSEQYLLSLERVVKCVQKIHPTVRLRIKTVERRGGIFNSVTELGLYTSNAEPSLWYDWCDEKNSPFVNRSDETSILNPRMNTLPMELRHREFLDPDSLPIDYELPADYLEAYGGYGDYDDYYGEIDGYDHAYDDFDDGYYDGNADELW